MSAAKHTPWRVGPPGLAVNAKGKIVASMRFGDTSVEDERANTLLVAAAPDMLQALRRAVMALAFAAESSDAMRDDYNAVSAAIAKATGATGEPA